VSALRLTFTKVYLRSVSHPALVLQKLDMYLVETAVLNEREFLLNISEQLELAHFAVSKIQSISALFLILGSRCDLRDILINDSRVSHQLSKPGRS
jgi:hypothetical protein